MSEHTKGPWAAQDGLSAGREVIAIGATNKLKRRVASCGGPDRDANALLIAAAPDLLEAARSTLNAIDDEGKLTGRDDEYIYDCLGSAMSGAYFSARAAIAKATLRSENEK